METLPRDVLRRHILDRAVDMHKALKIHSQYMIRMAMRKGMRLRMVCLLWRNLLDEHREFWFLCVPVKPMKMIGSTVYARRQALEQRRKSCIEKRRKQLKDVNTRIQTLSEENTSMERRLRTYPGIIESNKCNLIMMEKQRVSLEEFFSRVPEDRMKKKKNPEKEIRTKKPKLE